MDRFLHWLDLRERADHAARSVGLAHAVAAVLPGDRPIRVVDLGAGTGSNVRFLAPLLPQQQEWLLIDSNPTVLAAAPERLRSLAVARRVRYATRQWDLGAVDLGEILRHCDLVTASALLDLVSERWLQSLAAGCAEAGAAALFALTYTGESSCAPPEPEDDLLRGLLNRHQRANDKGFGRAAGPDAVDAAERSFAAAGCRVRREPGDWHLSPDMRELQLQLVEGWAGAAIEIAPDRSAAVRDWLARRVAHVEAGRSRIVVRHEDLAAWPQR